MIAETVDSDLERDSLLASDRKGSGIGSARHQTSALDLDKYLLGDQHDQGIRKTDSGGGSR